MVTSHRAPARERRRAPLLAAATAALLALSAPFIVGTSAAFTSGVDAATTQSGGIRLAQGPSEKDRYPDSAHPHQVTVDRDGAQSIAYLASVSSRPPSVPTASFTVTVQLLTPSRDVVLRATLHDPSPAPGSWLLFDVRAKGASLLPSATPLGADAIAALNDGAGLVLPTPDAGTGLAITVRVWLAPTAPPAAFNAPVTPAIAITAETVGGRTVSLEEDLP